MTDDDIKALREALESVHENDREITSSLTWLEAASPDRIARLLDEVETLRAALAEPGQHCTYPTCQPLTAGGCDGPCGQARGAA
jgi:hypothetical protein